MLAADIVAANRRAWNNQARRGESRWVQPAGPGEIAAARRGGWKICLTPLRPVPRAWFGRLDGADLLCLASAGGQQAPILAAAGARVTSYDNSDEQLARDTEVAAREGLALRCVRGDMADLGEFAAASFDLVFHPVSNVFVADVRPVWQECARVLRPGGRLLAGFMNPDFFLFDHAAIERGMPLEVRFVLPYSDAGQLTAEAIERRVEAGQAVEFSHSMEAQIGAQIEAGFSIAGFYEDRWDDAATPLNRYMPTSFATLAIRGG